MEQLAARMKGLSARDQGWVRNAVFTGLRFWPQLEHVASRYLKKPLRGKDRDIFWLIITGLLQLGWLRTDSHAAINETVAATGKRWARGLINAVLRSFQRDDCNLALPASDAVRLAHPGWIVSRLRNDWGDHAEAILAANNQQPPLWLRVNGGGSEYLRENGLDGQTGARADAVRLAKPSAAEDIPGLRQGHVSVQDQAAQWAAPELGPRAGMRILDACAAPGGKSIHIKQLAPDCDLTCVDIDQARLAAVQENLERTGISASMILADAGRTDLWWDGNPYDAILIDAPCSGSGVIRRHPDIKWLRRDDDIPRFAERQGALLTSLWPLVRTGGRLVYTTCSVFRAENVDVALAFENDTDGASPRALSLPEGRAETTGWQLFPGQGDCDGFYFASWDKCES